MKINSLELENVKRIKAVVLTPTANGLTVIGGNNGQGKTSVLDSIAWALGGEKFRPSVPQRDGSLLPPSLRIVMDNGLIVERKGKNSDLKVTDPQGRRAGQQLLNEFVTSVALDLPKFMGAGDKEKAETLLQVIGVRDQLYALEQKETELYNRRHAIGQIADQKAKHAAELPEYPDAPTELVSASDLIRQQQDILAKNAENQRKRERMQEFEKEANRLTQEITDLKLQIKEKSDALTRTLADLETARKDALFLHDESTEELERNLEEIDRINLQVRANLDHQKAKEEAAEFAAHYTELTAELEAVRAEKRDLLERADLPLPELTVEHGVLLYGGYPWDNLSGADQLKVAVAIVRKLNSKCEFVLLDKLEQMDTQTLSDFGAWLEQEGLQAIATRVSTGGECSVIIEDGSIKSSSALPKWEG